MADNIQIATDAARKWHDGQVRKFTGRPYVTHPESVAARLNCHMCEQKYFTSRHIDVVTCAALLHDVVEDCRIQTIQIAALFPHDPEFGKEVADLVQEVTNPSKQHPELSRADRKAMDREHISQISAAAKMIKLVDRTDNMLDAVYDREFAALYAPESRLLLGCLVPNSATLVGEYTLALLELEKVAGTAPESPMRFP